MKKIIICIAIALLIAIGIGVFIYNSPDHRISRSMNLAKSLFDEGQWEEAKVELNKIIEIDATNLDAHIMLADVYKNLNDTENQIAVYEKIIEIAPEREQTYLDYAEIYIAQEDWQKAREILQRGNGQAVKNKLAEIEKIIADIEEAKRKAREEAERLAKLVIFDFQPEDFTFMDVPISGHIELDIRSKTNVIESTNPLAKKGMILGSAYSEESALFCWGGEKGNVFVEICTSYDKHGALWYDYENSMKEYYKTPIDGMSYDEIKSKFKYNEIKEKGTQIDEYRWEFDCNWGDGKAMLLDYPFNNEFGICTQGANPIYYFYAWREDRGVWWQIGVKE